MPKQGMGSGNPKNIDVQKRKKKSTLTSTTKAEIRDLIQEYQDPDNLQEQIRAVLSESSPGISGQEVREAAAGEIRAYHRSKGLSGKIEEETRAQFDQMFAEKMQQLNNSSGEDSEKTSGEEMRKMLLSAFDQYHRSPQLEKRIQKVMGDSVGLTRKDVEKEIFENLKKYHHSEQLRKRILNITSSLSPAEEASDLSTEEIITLIREETEALLKSEVLLQQIEHHSRQLVDKLVEKEMHLLLDSPDVEQRIRDICRSFSDETSINLPVIASEEMRDLVRKELDADQKKHPVSSEPNDVPIVARKIAEKEIAGFLRSEELRSLIRKISGEVVRKLAAPIGTRSDLDRAVPSGPVTQQVESLLGEVLPYPEEMEEEMPYLRRRVRRKYRR